MIQELLKVSDLSVRFGNREKQVTVIDGLSFSLQKGETLGIVGESGSGKSVTSLAVMGLLPAETAKVSGSIELDGTDLLALPPKKMQDVRGNKISMIFQEPMTSLNPIQTCGKQIMEPMFLHQDIDKKRGPKACH